MRNAEEDRAYLGDSNRNIASSWLDGSSDGGQVSRGGVKVPSGSNVLGNKDSAGLESGFSLDSCDRLIC